MAHEERRLNDFVRAALLPFGRVERVRRVPLSPGGSNRVFFASVGSRELAVKLRVDRDDDAGREAWALRAAPVDIAPRLLLHATPRELVAAASAAGDIARAVRLDAPVGGVLVLERVDGRSPRGPLDVDRARRIARSLRRLHARAPTGPAVHVGKTPGSAARLAYDMLERMERWRALERAIARDLGRMLRRAADGAALVQRRRTRLCHGDLRLHNLVDDGREVRWIDFEHAGVGDPVADLLLFSVRTPLSRHDEQLLWEALLDVELDRAPARTGADLEAYFRERPLFVLVSALAAVHDVCAVAAGDRPVARATREHVEERLRGAREELAEALGRPVRVRPPIAAASKRTPRPRHTVIAVDGTASSGKSIVADGLARALGLRHVNTGLAYRAAALLALLRGLEPDAVGARALARLVRRTEIEIVDRDAVLVARRPLDLALATVEVERVVARFAEHACVRDALAPALARATRGGGLVIEGRAIAATTPRARAAIFVDADVEVRADRLRGRVGRSLARSAAVALLSARDRRDAERDLEPNLVSARATVIDTTHVGIDDAIRLALAACARQRRT